MASEASHPSKDQGLLGLIRDFPCEGNMAELARRINKDQSYVARLFYPADKKGAKGIGIEIVRACNEAFTLPPGYWEMALEDAQRWMKAQVFEPRSPAYVGGDRPVVMRVPLISWVRAGTFDSISDPLEPGDAIRFIDLDKRIGIHSFALELEGDSMFNPLGAPSFPEKTIIVVDPDKGAQPGSFVIAKNIASQKATFKKLMTDGFTATLRALNPDKSAYPDIPINDENIRIIATLQRSLYAQDF